MIEVGRSITLPYGWKLYISSGMDAYLQVQCTNDKCNVTGEPMSWHGRKWRISQHMTRSEIVQTALAATLAAVEHEAREKFLYKGHSIFDPHYDVGALLEIRKANRLEHRGDIG